MSHGRAVAALVVTACALSGFLLLHLPSSDESEPATARTPATAQGPAEARLNDGTKLIAALLPKRPPIKRTPRPPDSPHAPREDRADVLVAGIKPAAEAGDLAAMRELGEVLAECARADMGSDSEIEASAAKFSLNIENLQKQGVDSVVLGETDPTRMAVRMAESKKRLRDSCRKIPADELKTANDWLARAASTGDERAALDLAGTFAPRIKDGSLTVEQREEARSQMIDLLQDQIALGHCNSMVLNLFWQQSNDPMLIYIYGGILMRRGMATIDSQPPEKRESELAALQQADREFAAALPQDQLAAAEATRAYIEANYCSNWQWAF